MRFPGRFGRAAVPWLGGAVLALACDASTRGRDASPPLSQRVSEVSVRIDVPGGGAPAISVLAFRASVSGLTATDVLGVVDPLVAPQPELKQCEVRDVAAAARLLRAQGGGIELEELANVSLTLDNDVQALRPAAHIYPQLASAVGGVIAEAGPVDLARLPGAITVVLSPGEPPIKLEVLGVPRLLDGTGAPLAAIRLEANGDLSLTVSGPTRSFLERSFLEIRPFGASLALACPLGADGKVLVPREKLDRVVPPGGHVPVSLEAVWRDPTLVPVASGAGGQTARLSLEVRSSTVLDLHAAVTTDSPRPALPTVP
jgi:hypothetical protein